MEFIYLIGWIASMWYVFISLYSQKVKQRKEAIDSHERETSPVELEFGVVIGVLFVSAIWSLFWPIFLPFMIYQNNKERKNEGGETVRQKAIDEFYKRHKKPGEG